MTDEQKSLIQMLEFIRDTHAKNKLPEDWVYKGPADILVREGRWYKPETGQLRNKQAEFKACFRNAAVYAKVYGLHYVEGYANKIIPVHHAWCADDNDNVYEVTWQAMGSAYFGVEFNPMKVLKGSVLFNERQSETLYKKLIKRADHAVCEKKM